MLVGAVILFFGKFEVAVWSSLGDNISVVTVMSNRKNFKHEG